MPTQAEVVWDPGFTRYDFGPTHPMSPVRLDLTARLCDAFGLFDLPDVHRLDPGIASDALLETVHSAAYVAAVKAASLDPETADGAYGLGTDDDPAFVGMHEASARGVEPPQGSASTTTWPSGSSGCSTTASSGSPTSMSTSTMVTASSASSGTTSGSSRCRSTSRAGRCSRAPAGPATSVGRTPRGRPPTSPCRPGSPTPAGCARSTPLPCRSSERSAPRCWSASTAATPTCRTRWRTSR